MNDRQPALNERVAQLRETFDRSFSRPLATPAEANQRLLIVGVGEDRYAVRLDAVLGVEKRRKIAPLPLRAPGLLGLAGFGGRLATVFDLAALLGVTADAGPPAWLAFCKGESVALAFHRFEGTAEVREQDICAAQPTEGSPQPDQQTVRIGPEVLSLIDAPTIVAAARRSLLAAQGAGWDLSEAGSSAVPQR